MKFLILKDLTEGMSEPCVMDVKIGRRTWDPLSGPAKKAGEEKKYAECKLEYGFCIPGFQVFKPSTGTVKKYDKEFGKKLDKQKVVEGNRELGELEHEESLQRDILTRIYQNETSSFFFQPWKYFSTPNQANHLAAT